MRDQATPQEQHCSALWELIRRMPKSPCERWTLYGLPVVMTMCRSLALYFSVVIFNGALEIVFSEAQNTTVLERETNLTLSGNRQPVTLGLPVLLLLYAFFSLRDSHIQWMRLWLLPVIENMCRHYSSNLVAAYFEKTEEFQQNHDPQELAFLHHMTFERLGSDSLLLMCSLIPSVLEFFFTSILLAAEGLNNLAGFHLLSTLFACVFCYLYARFVVTPKFFIHLEGLNNAYPKLFQHVARFPLARNCGAIVREQERAATWLGDLSKHQLANNRSQQFTFIISALSYTVFFSLMLWFCAETVAANKLIVALLYLFNAYVPLQHMADSLNPLLGNDPSYKQLLNYLYDEGSFDHRYRDARLMKIVPAREEGPVLCLQNVSYKHPGQTESAIHDVSLELMPGQAVMVVGKSGQGKTTLVKALHGLGKLQDEGRVFLSGVDNRLISPEGLAQHTFMVSQNTVIFAGTVAENIRYVAPDTTDEELQRVAERVGFDQDMLRRHTGFNGGSLSGGERKRVALARALLMQARVIICDEITAGLDPTGQREVMQTVEALRAGGAAILFVTHRPDVAGKHIHFEGILEVEEGVVRPTTIKQLTEEGKLSQLSMLNRRGAAAHCESCTCSQGVTQYVQ